MNISKRNDLSLRARAEKKANKRSIKSSVSLESMTTEEMLKMLHELQVHQIELEMQNEELQIAQLELEDARERYFDLYDLAPIGYCTISENGLILEANLSAANLFGVLRSSLTRQPISRFIFKEDQDVFYLHRKQLLKTGQPQAFEMRMKKNDGTLFWVRLEATVVPVSSSQEEKDAGARTVFRVMLSDITVPKKAEEILRRDKTTLEKLVRKSSLELLKVHKELERSKRLKDIGVLAAIVAHELRNPLFGINLATTVIRKKTSDNMIGDQLQIIEKMLAESEQIIDNLLFYSQLRMPRCKIFNLNSLLKECIDSIQTKHSGKNIKVSKQIDSLENVAFSADSGQIKEVFSNILNNSIDAVPDPGGEIDIRARVYPETVKIHITDNGPGIPKQDLKKVFDPFFTTKEKGTGLGLTVCAQIVKMHGGSLNIKNCQEQGTSVIITLPKVKTRKRKKPLKIGHSPHSRIL